MNINVSVLIVREENRSTRRKTLEAQERSTRTLSHETHSPDMVSVVTGTTLANCLVRYCLLNWFSFFLHAIGPAKPIQIRLN